VQGAEARLVVATKSSQSDAWGKTFSHSYDVLSNIRKMMPGVRDGMSAGMRYVLCPKDLTHEVLEHRGICLR
jgi:hypothetical protein